MTPADLAQILVDCDPDLRESRLEEFGTIVPFEIAEALQQMCYSAWTENPQRVSVIAETLLFLERVTADAEVSGFASWAEGIRAIVGGELITSLGHIDRSESIFHGIGRSHLAAKTQTSKIYCLAMLGRYDEAVKVGEKALDTLLEHNDLYSAGKIEHNIGNLYWRRDLYREAEPYLESARLRFVEIDDQRQIAMVENCQAFVNTLQNRFRDAETIYKRALERADANDLKITEAEIETGLSNLYLFESRYDLALRFMERSRQKYERLEMPYQSAMCELEIADIYLELNLLPEAVDLYEKVGLRFADLGSQAELARCSLGHARAMIRLGRPTEAFGLLDKAETLYTLEGNSIATGSVRLARSELLIQQAETDKAGEQVDLAISAFEEGDNLRLYLFGKWLRSEIAYVSGRIPDAVAELEALRLLAKESSNEVEYLCLTSLGKILKNEQYLESAIELVEDARAGLSSDDLRTSYFAEKITPYNELIKIKFAKRQFEEAFYLHERSRARTLVEQLHQPGKVAHSDQRLASTREELNSYYRRMNRAVLSGTDGRSTIATLRKRSLEREKDYSELLRRIGSDKGADDKLAVNGSPGLDLERLSRHLADTTLVEFAVIDGRVSAFVISKDHLTALPGYASEADVNAAVKQFLFQLKTGRSIDRLSEASRRAASDRLRSHSRRIYDMLLGPIEHLIKTERVVFAPANLLHNLPFHALHNGDEYLIERVEVSYAPSISVLDSCLNKQSTKHQQVLLVGVPDAKAPMVECEIETVAQFFEDPVQLMGPQATVENINRNALKKGIIHFACHGKFRPDNPGFSSLVLHEGELTANDVRNLSLDACVIILSACETGLNDVVRGEELLGLTRAFFAAGAATMVLSLWRVNDEATLELMKIFYKGLCGGTGASAALRRAQRHLIGENLHPYFWSPFVVSGRW